MGFVIGNMKNPMDAKKAAMEAAKAAAKGIQPGENTALMHWISPDKCADRIRVVFDDSGSMHSQIENAKKGVVEFLRNCIPNQTAVALHFMNTTHWNTTLRSDLPLLGSDVEEVNLDSGGTPFFNTLKKALEATPTLTRLIAFTDGSPTDMLSAEESTEMSSSWDTSSAWTSSADVIIKIASSTGAGIPIDTVYFGEGNEDRREIVLLKYLSSKTGGYFLHFDPAKVNFAQAFKYLAPINRLML